MNLFDTSDPSIYDIQTKAAGPTGALPLTPEMLKTWSSGDLFGLSPKRRHGLGSGVGGA